MVASPLGRYVLLDFWIIIEPEIPLRNLFEIWPLNDIRVGVYNLQTIHVINSKWRFGKQKRNKNTTINNK